MLLNLTKKRTVFRKLFFLTANSFIRLNDSNCKLFETASRVQQTLYFILHIPYMQSKLFAYMQYTVKVSLHGTGFNLVAILQMQYYKLFSSRSSRVITLKNIRER